MDFKEATDRLTMGTTVTLSQVAEAFGVTLNTVSRMRSGSGRNNLRPPANWQRTVAQLARSHAKEIQHRSRELEQLAAELSAE
jgi:inosine/xanthosine triphosphate pyrophosphatase family protein